MYSLVYKKLIYYLLYLALKKKKKEKSTVTEQIKISNYKLITNSKRNELHT